MKDYSFLKADPSQARRLGHAEPHPHKNDFQRDRDRVLYSRIFRRLDKKTQVFVSGFDDNIRTRLTHTLEVAQIARRIASIFGFDTDLAEAMALAHDTGHTPFGHTGEKTLNFFMNGCEECYGYEELFDAEEVSGFKHNLQGFKSLNELEIHRNDEKALNLTTYTLWGVVNHTTQKYKKKCEFCHGTQCLKNNKPCPHGGIFNLDYYDHLLSQLNKEDWTFEGVIVAMADEIAQLHHDFEDGVCGRLITVETLISICKEHFNNDLLNSIRDDDNKLCKLSTFCSAIIEDLIYDYCDLLEKGIEKVVEEFKIETAEDFAKNKADIYDFVMKNVEKGYFCDFFNDVSNNPKFTSLQQVIPEVIILSELTQTMNGKAAFIVSRLFKAYLRNPQQLPDKTVLTITNACMKLGVKGMVFEPLTPYEFPQRFGIARKNLGTIINANNEDYKRIIMRTICDYIAGMTDDYAIAQHDKLYGSDNLRYV